MTDYRVLVIEDSPEISLLIQELLESQGYIADTANSVETAERQLEAHEFDYDCVLLDYRLGDEDGSQLLGSILGRNPAQSVIVMTAYGTIEKAVETLNQGALNYITKPFDNPQLLHFVEQACERSALKKENRRLQTMLTGKPPIESIIGTSPMMMKLYEQIRQVAQVDSTVLITGESGTGKELVARALHDLGTRAKNRFGAINCGAIPANLLESELFGHKRGAFTDARTDRKGLFESCNTGSLFLDEIGEMPIELQVKLLRVLQEKEIVPLGTDKSVSVDVRIITATNKNLREEVRKTKFREDLFFRINVIPLHVPALRERKEDIPLLAHHFLWQYSKQFGKKMEPIPEEIMRKLVAYDWPGNVRELQNNIERAVVMSVDGRLHTEHIFMDTMLSGATDGPRSEPLLPYSEAKERFEKNYLDHLLEAAGGNITEAARLAGRYRADIYRLLSKYHFKHSKR
ncbi:MAG: sigma-54 dependent transcriptional regulator [Bdellovibrionota bacterium]